MCRVRAAWAQTISDDPTGAFDLRIDPWDSNYQTPDIWVDRDPFGSFDTSLDSAGRPLSKTAPGTGQNRALQASRALPDGGG